jgi:putative MFS transporter
VRRTIRAGLLVCAAAVLALLGARAAAARLALLFAARAAIEATFSALYVYTPELYPTAVRSFGLALCNAFSRLGGFAAPFATVYLVERGRTGAAEGLLGVLCLAAAAAAFALRYETRGRDLQAERLEADGQAAAAAWRHGGGGGGGGGPGPATELEEARPLVR